MSYFRKKIPVWLRRKRERKKGSCPKSAIEVEGFWKQQVGNRAAGVNPRFI
jgi:hypothetical protein